MSAIAVPVPEEYVMIEGLRYLAVYQNGTIPGWITISAEVADYWMDSESLKP